MRRRSIVAGLLLLAVSGAVAACSTAAATPPPAVGPTPCGGSHAWPPNGYRAAAPGLTADIVTGRTVIVRNGTERTWTVRVAPWEDLPCAGYMTTDGVSHVLRAGDAYELTVAEPTGWGGRLRIGVEVWAGACDGACQVEPDGFLSVDP